MIVAKNAVAVADVKMAKNANADQIVHAVAAVRNNDKNPLQRVFNFVGFMVKQINQKHEKNNSPG